MSDRSITPGEVIGRLDALAEELGKVSNALATVERQLEPVDREFREFVDNHEIGLYERSITEDGFSSPAEALRQKLAVRAMPRSCTAGVRHWCIHGTGRCGGSRR